MAATRPTISAFSENVLLPVVKVVQSYTEYYLRNINVIGKQWRMYYRTSYNETTGVIGED